MDRHRLRRRWQSFLDRQSTARADTRSVQDELLAVWAEVDRLPERQRQVLYLRYRADLTFEEIGEVLGMDPASARSSASRGIAALRERLGEEAD
jgi:RNA polymerase sigma factor (sigma-70 family)